MKWDEQAARFLRKAAMDERAMSALIAAPQADDEVIGFHAQQAVEKYLKALLSHRRLAFGRTHDLQTLIDLLKAHGDTPPPLVEEACQLFPYAVEYRYDDMPAAPPAAIDHSWMLSHVQAVRTWVESRMNPPPLPPSSP